MNIILINYIKNNLAYSKTIFGLLFFVIFTFSSLSLFAQSMEQLEEQFQKTNSDSVKAHLKNQMAALEIEKGNL